MNIKFLALTLIAAFSIGSINAQMSDKKKRPSPPATLETEIDGAAITIDYSQPAVKDREIFGKLIPFGKVWRTGANEATTFTTSKDIMVNGKALKAGTYSFFTIPGESEWTLIFNTEMGQWGAYKYDDKKDALKVSVKSSEHATTERMTFSSDGKNIYLDWADTRVTIPIKG